MVENRTMANTQNAFAVSKSDLESAKLVLGQHFNTVKNGFDLAIGVLRKSDIQATKTYKSSVQLSKRIVTTREELALSEDGKALLKSSGFYESYSLMVSAINTGKRLMTLQEKAEKISAAVHAKKTAAAA